MNLHLQVEAKKDGLQHYQNLLPLSTKHKHRFSIRKCKTTQTDGLSTKEQKANNFRSFSKEIVLATGPPQIAEATPEFTMDFDNFGYSNDKDIDESMTGLSFCRSLSRIRHTSVGDVDVEQCGDQ